MAPRDPRIAKLAAVERSAATLARCEKQLNAARAHHRAVIMAAVDAGISKAELARRLGTSETRLRHHVNRARVE